MKRFLILTIFIGLTLPCFCEAIKLKNGIIINGSIVDQSEYILKVKTSYGTIAINQREVEKIMPDLHRVLLKGGGELVGTVVDLDEFNLSLKTDAGLVNVDVAQIASMEVYDYEEAEKQKKYVENKIEQENSAKEESATLATAGTATGVATAQTAGNISSSGLAFDDDLEKVFPSKPQVVEQETQYVYKTHETTPEELKAEEKEKQAAKELSPEEKEQREAEEALSFDQNKKRTNSKNYFAVQAGALNSSINVNLKELEGPEDFKVDGNNAAFSLAYMRRLSKRFWFGGGFSFGLLGKKTTQYNLSVSPQERYVEISGRMYDASILFNFYLNPDSPFRIYLTGGGGYTSFNVDRNVSTYKDISSTLEPDYKWVVEPSEGLNSSSISGNGGIGLEYTIDDINIGLEVRARFMPLKGQLKESSSTSIFATLKASWFF